MKRDLIRAELLRLANKGGLTPEAVVKLAAPLTSPLHKLFEWDDSKAARHYRLDQARELISSFELTITINRVEVSIQEFVRDPSKGVDAQGYVPVTSIKSESDEAREFVLRELVTARAYVNRAERYSAVLGLTKDIRGLSNRLEELSHTLSKV